MSLNAFHKFAHSDDNLNIWQFSSSLLQITIEACAKAYIEPKRTSTMDLFLQEQ